MPKTFSKQEREIIKQSMLKVGAALLRKKGIRHVTVEDITKGANIAKGSFYSFYNSREQLFWDIVKLEEKQILDQILAIAAMDLDVRTKVQKIFYDAYLKEGSIAFYLQQEDIEYIARKMPPEMLQAEEEGAHDFNRTLLSLCHLDTSQENIEFLFAMEELMLTACSSSLPQTDATRKKVVNILVEGFADYLSGGDIK